MTKSTFAALLAMLATAACGKSDDNASSKPESSPAGKKVDRVADPKKVEALKAAYASTPDCQTLVACCKHIASDDKWKSTFTPVCQQISKDQNFEEQVKNMVEPAFQTTVCRNRVDALAQMGNRANPVPAACKRG